MPMFTILRRWMISPTNPRPTTSSTGYFDLDRLYKINIIGSYFIIRQKGRLQYKIIDGEDLVEGVDGVIRDQTIELTGYSIQKEIP
jgi:hypothetical protein